MIVLSIKGLTDGKYPIQETANSTEIEHFAEEFFGTVSITGTLRKHGKRYLADIHAEVQARFLCDLSGEEFEETVTTDFSLEYIANTMLANLNDDKTDAEPPFYIRDDDTKIDITDEIRQELMIHLPMRRIAPKFRDKEFDEVFPEFSADAKPAEPQIDPRWAALKSISFDKK